MLQRREIIWGVEWLRFALSLSMGVVNLPSIQSIELSNGITKMRDHSGTPRGFNQLFDFLPDPSLDAQAAPPTVSFQQSPVSANGVVQYSEKLFEVAVLYSE